MTGNAPIRARFCHVFSLAYAGFHATGVLDEIRYKVSQKQADLTVFALDRGVHGPFAPLDTPCTLVLLVSFLYSAV